MPGMQWNVDFGQVSKAIGAVYGIADASEMPQYLSNILDDAHAEAAEAFDRTAATIAAAGGGIKHMYEWGTTGINNERTTRRFSDPTSPQARLYQHVIAGEGSNIKDITWVPRQSVVPVPRPTVKKTGIEKRYLDKLSNNRYVFYNKAMVMETGQEVTLAHSKTGLLFVPFYGNPSPDARATDKRRGFMMYPLSKGPITMRPGAKVAGRFTALWTGWWNQTGVRMMELRANSDFNRHIAMVLTEAEKGASTQLSPVQARKYKADISRQRTKATKQMLRASSTTRKGSRLSD